MKPATDKMGMGTKRRKKMRERMKQAVYEDAVLACDVPEHHLRRGDIVKLVDHQVGPDGAEGYFYGVKTSLTDEKLVPGFGPPPMT